MPANVGFRDLIRARAENLLPEDLRMGVVAVKENHAAVAPLADWLTEHDEPELGRAAHWILKSGVTVDYHPTNGSVRLLPQSVPDYMIGYLGHRDYRGDLLSENFDTFLYLLLAISERVESLRKAVDL